MQRKETKEGAGDNRRSVRCATFRMEATIFYFVLEICGFAALCFILFFSIVLENAELLL